MVSANESTQQTASTTTKPGQTPSHHKLTSNWPSLGFERSSSVGRRKSTHKASPNGGQQMKTHRWEKNRSTTLRTTARSCSSPRFRCGTSNENSNDGTQRDVLLKRIFTNVGRKQHQDLDNIQSHPGSRKTSHRPLHSLRDVCDRLPGQVSQRSRRRKRKREERQERSRKRKGVTGACSRGRPIRLPFLLSVPPGDRLGEGV